MRFYFDLDAPLSYGELCERLERIAPGLNCIREFRQPDRQAPLHVLVKDNIGVSGFKTCAGSDAFRNLSLEDAPCITALRRHGVDVFGKTHMTELAGFVSTKNLVRAYSQLGGYGINPYGDYPTGGSSSGSAVSVAAGLCDAALGTETRGSLMSPGLNCGVFSFKPTRGAISTEGVIPLSSYLDTVGIIGRSLETISSLFSMTRRSPADNADSGPHFQEKTNDREIRMGVLQSYLADEFPEELKGLERRMRDRGISLDPVKYLDSGNDYKVITSNDFIVSMDIFLKLHADQVEPKSFVELFDFYQRDPARYKNGMDRLEDCFTVESLTYLQLSELARRNISRAETIVEGLLAENRSDALLSVDFVDLWSISGYPSLTVPLFRRDGRPPYTVMIGGGRNSDELLLEIGKRLAWLDKDEPGEIELKL